MYEDPGDDEREALRMSKEAGQNNWKWSLAILIGGPTVVSLLLWLATK